VSEARLLGRRQMVVGAGRQYLDQRIWKEAKVSRVTEDLGEWLTLQEGGPH
jgi:hypothetical protein